MKTLINKYDSIFILCLIGPLHFSLLVFLHHSFWMGTFLLFSSIHLLGTRLREAIPWENLLLFGKSWKVFVIGNSLCRRGVGLIQILTFWWTFLVEFGICLESGRWPNSKSIEELFFLLAWTFLIWTFSKRKEIFLWDGFPKGLVHALVQ